MDASSIPQLRPTGWTAPAMAALADNAAVRQRMRALLDARPGDNPADLAAAIDAHATTCLTDALSGGTYHAALEAGQGQVLLDMAAAIDAELAQHDRRHHSVVVAIYRILDNIKHVYTNITAEIDPKLDAHSLLVVQMVDARLGDLSRAANPAELVLLRMHVRGLEEQIAIDRRGVRCMVILFTCALLLLAACGFYIAVYV